MGTDSPPHLSFKISFLAVGPFLEYWASRYRDAPRDCKLYDPYIGKADLQTNWHALQALFEWKNGGTISQQKLASIRKNYFKDWTEDSRLEDRYLDPKKGGGHVWNIFYLHCRHPERYPIYDQHTYRAMRFMETGRLEEIPRAPAKAYCSYKNDYVPFVEKLSSDKRTVDRALYTFGQFLKLAEPFWA